MADGKAKSSDQELEREFKTRDWEAITMADRKTKASYQELDLEPRSETPPHKHLCAEG